MVAILVMVFVFGLVIGMLVGVAISTDGRIRISDPSEHGGSPL